MLRKKSNRTGRSRAGILHQAAKTKIDRRSFLRGSGLAVGGLAALAATTGRVGKAQAQVAGSNIEIRKSVCTHCSVGCTVLAEVENGVWTGQEPGWDSPFNLGAHCAKGASVREHVHNERRLKYPMKLEGGEWKRLSWEDAINEIGPCSVYWLGSAKHHNEQAYLFRKFAAYWGTNNVDHQARICHSTTVAGVANTWGYGAMTNSYNDIHNSRAIFIIGGNPAEAHPVSLLHVLRAKEQNNAPLIVCDPRFTRTAAHADEYVRFRPGTDVPLIWGILWHIFENGWEDKEFIRTRVWGMDQIRTEVAKWTHDEIENVTVTPGSQPHSVDITLADGTPLFDDVSFREASAFLSTPGQGYDVQVRVAGTETVALSFGDVPLAANQVLLQFLHITAYAMDGFAFAAETLVGRAMGAGRRAALRRAAWMTSQWGLAICALLALAFALGGGWLIDVMTTAPEVREAARAYLPWMLDGIFIGATRTADMRNMMVVSALIYAAAVAVLTPLFGNHGLWIALLISFVARGATLWLRYPALEAAAEPKPA